MPRIVDETVFDENPRVGGHLYPWHEWLDGTAREFTQGDDFKVTLTSFSRCAQNAGRSRGIRVRTHQTSATTVVIQALRETP